MKTTDLWFAAFLKMNGFKIIDFEVISRGKGAFIFDISESDWKNMRIKFMSSETSKAKQIMLELKDMLF